MANATATRLELASRTPAGSRAARRLRRSDRVPGVIYGGGDPPVSFDVDARELRHALAAAGAVLEVSVDGAGATPVVLKDAQRDPVRGHTVHVDLLRVRLDRPIQTSVTIELQGAEDSPGVKLGGVLEHPARETLVEALPGAIPEALVHDVSGLEIGDIVTIASLVPPSGVTLLDDPETVVATLHAPRLQVESDEIEQETEVVGAEQPAADETAEEDGGGAAEEEG